MRILGPPGGAFVVTILDISKNGLRVRCTRPLPNGTHVEIKCRRKLVTGEIRYARTIESSGVHLGIEAVGVAGVAEEINLIELFPDLIRR